MPRHFLIVARPRSRTSWLATFLNTSGVVCQHDLIDQCSGPVAYRKALENFAGTSGASDTGAVLFLDRLLVEMPECQVIVIDRPRNECEESMAQIGIPMNMECYDEPMEKAKNLPGSFWVKYQDLDDEAVVRSIWNMLTFNPFPKWWYDHCRWMQIEPSKEFFKTEFIRRSQNSAILSGWLTKAS